MKWGSVSISTIGRPFRARPVTQPLMRTDRLSIAKLALRDCDDLRTYYLDNREHLDVWEPKRTAAFHSIENWRARASLAEQEMREGRCVKLVVRDAESQDVLGVCNFSNIVRGPFQACTLGYSLAEQAQGRGIMFEALTASIDYMFRVENLHRIMANHLPENERSARLLARLGFEVEGLAKAYLQIAGTWRDHVLTARTNPDHRTDAW